MKDSLIVSATIETTALATIGILASPVAAADVSPVDNAGVNGTSQGLTLEGQDIRASLHGEESAVSFAGGEHGISGSASWRTGLDGGAYAVDSNEDFQFTFAAPSVKLEDGRAAPSAVHASVGWKEAVKKGVDKPTKGLHEQYVCHPMSKVARVKSSWNVEAWRPTAGIAKTVAALCNPK